MNNNSDVSFSFPALGLRHQGVLLAAIPIVELIFVLLVSFANWQVEDAARKEQHARSVLATAHDFEQNVTASYLSLTALGVAGQGAVAAKVDELRRAVATNYTQLKDLLKEDPDGLRNLEDIRQSNEKIAELTLQLEQSLDKSTGRFNFWQFLHEGDFWQELNFYVRKLNVENGKLVEKYSHGIETLQPAAARARQIYSMIAVVAVVVNVGLAAVLSVYFSQRTLKRLSSLEQNIKLFQSNKSLLPPLIGSDELSNLDIAFREMSAARAKAEQQRKDLMNMVSHDLRTPMTSIVGYLDMMMDGRYGDLNDKQTKVVSKVEAELTRLIRLFNTLLDMERIESGVIELEKKITSAKILCEVATNAVSAMAEAKKLSLQYECPVELHVLCDQDRIVQVLVNFLSNAVKFSPPGETVLLRVHEKENACRFDVIDSGPGMTEEQAATLFQAFTQLEQPEEVRRLGTGLGLSISKSLIECHGGRIGVESQKGRGSTFWFELLKN